MMHSADNDLASRILEAIEDGEILRVRYDRGSQPGTVRDIRPVSVLGDRIRAHDEVSLVPKVFLLKYLEIVSSADPTNYVARKTKRKTIGDPAKLTASWHFSVPMPAFAPALDISHSPRKRVDLHTAQKINIRVWTQGSPPAYQFCEGDIFHHPHCAATEAWGSVDSHSCIQILDADDEFVEIAISSFQSGIIESQTVGVRLSNEDFLTVLESGPKAPAWQKIAHRQRQK